MKDEETYFDDNGHIKFNNSKFDLDLNEDKDILNLYKKKTNEHIKKLEKENPNLKFIDLDED